MWLFVSETERYAEIPVDRRIFSRISDNIWHNIVEAFTQRVRLERTLPGFLKRIEYSAVNALKT